MGGNGLFNMTLTYVNGATAPPASQVQTLSGAPKSHQDSFYLVPSKASILDHSPCSMHIMYREHVCFLLDMHVVEDFCAWKAFSGSGTVFSEEQASLLQEDHGDNHGADHGGCLGFH